MKLSNRNIFVRLYEHLNDEYPTNLCGLFWFSVFAILIVPVFIIVIVGVPILLLILFILNFELALLLLVLKLIAIVVIFYAVVVGSIYGLIRITPDKITDAISNKAEKVGDIIAVVKNRYCPRITIIETFQPSKQ